MSVAKALVLLCAMLLGGMLLMHAHSRLWTVQTLDPFLEYHSDIVELDHCLNNSDLSIRQEIRKQTEDLLHVAMVHVQRVLQPKRPQNPALENRRRRKITQDEVEGNNFRLVTLEMRHELTLQLLELHLMERKWCNFSLYRPTVHGHQAQGTQLQQVSQLPPMPQQAWWYNPFWRRVAPAPKSSLYRLAIVISAFKDFEQLVSLLQAVHLPQHYIVIHIDRHCDLAYRAQLQHWLTATTRYQRYRNVVVVQFGSVVYMSDSISHINLRILQWLTFDLQLEYQQVMLMDGLAFPLRSPTEMVQYLKEQSSPPHNRSVWLGLMQYSQFDYFDYASGQRPEPDTRTIRLTRLLLTNSKKVSTGYLYWKEPPDYIRNLFIYKSNSGNQGVYSRAVVEKLLTSNVVMELFAWSKYSCCCCIEENNWMAALDAIGHAADAMQSTNMFQVWGGESSSCDATTSNAVLTTNASIAYISADPVHFKVSKSSPSPDQFCFNGSQTTALLAQAKARGAMFARKFRSQVPDSVALMEWIRTNLWKLP
jgi:hypothetical protein